MDQIIFYGSIFLILMIGVFIMSILSDIADIKKQIASLNAVTKDDVNTIVDSKTKDILDAVNKLNDVVGINDPVDPQPTPPTQAQ